MKIAIDLSPLNDQSKISHRVRGVGFYLKYLKEGLLKYYPENDYLFFTDAKDLKSDIDLVHYPYFDPFFITLPFFKKHKTIVTVHDLTPLVFPDYFPSGAKGKLKWQIQKRSLRNTNAIITDSESSKKDISKYVGISKNKIDTVYLAAGEEFRQMANGKWQMAIRDKYKLPKKFVLYVGDVTWNKNLPRLIKAISKTNIPLIMVGSALANDEFDKNNQWNQDLRDSLKLIEQNNKIKKLGFIPTEDLVGIYNLATVFTMPSLYEGFGLPILEAMQSGCPVITTRKGSIPEVAGSAAFFVDSGNVDDIAKGISKVFEDSKLQNLLSEKGLSQAKKFSWKNTATQTIETYKKSLNI